MFTEDQTVGLDMAGPKDNHKTPELVRSYSTDYREALLHMIQATNRGDAPSPRDIQSLETRIQTLYDRIKGAKPLSGQDLLSLIALTTFIKRHGSRLDVSEYQKAISESLLQNSSAQNLFKLRGLIDRMNTIGSEINTFQVVGRAPCDYFLPTFIDEPLADATLRFYIQSLPVRYASRGKDNPESAQEHFQVESVDHNGWTFALFGFPDREGFEASRTKMIEQAKGKIEEAMRNDKGRSE